MYNGDRNFDLDRTVMLYSELSKRTHIKDLVDPRFLIVLPCPIPLHFRFFRGLFMQKGKTVPFSSETVFQEGKNTGFFDSDKDLKTAVELHKYRVLKIII